MKLFSLLKRFAVAQTMAVSFFLLLESLAYGGVQLLRQFSPGAADGFLVNLGMFWKLMGATGIAVALLAGGPSYLLCTRWMRSRQGPVWVAGSITGFGGMLLFAYALGETLSHGCG
jgi:hypothetical protein